MSTTETKTGTQTDSKSDASRSSVVDTLFDVGTQWAALGLNFGKAALQQSARTLETTAKSLEAIAKGLEKKEEPKGAAEGEATAKTDSTTK